MSPYLQERDKLQIGKLPSEQVIEIFKLYKVPCFEGKW